MFYANALRVTPSNVDICITFFISRPEQEFVGGVDIYCSPEYAARVHAALGRALERFEPKELSQEKSIAAENGDEG
jgi:hypothetical protein